MQIYRNIPVTPEVYEQVQRIAKANYRKLGHQVAYWAKNTCEHPTGRREYFDVQISYPGQVETVQALAYKCEQCGEVVVGAEKEA